MQNRQIAPLLLQWFDQNQRALPFRSDPTPYHVWVSEIMLQQTRVAAALPYYRRWMAELPTVRHLAECDPERLNKLWEGLGYYSRVRNLQKAARIVCEQYGGRLPADVAALRALPGVGEYTAGAIAAIGFGLPEPAVDGNVLRVFARLYAHEGDIFRAAVKKELTARVREQLPPQRPGDFDQALMELGALVCLPGGAARCEVCPLRDLCEAQRLGCVARLPVRPAPRPRKAQRLTAVLLWGPRGWLLQKRPARGLLAGLWQPYLWPQTLDGPQMLEQLAALGLTAVPGAALPPVHHVFTHVEWQVEGWLARTRADAPPPPNCVWAAPEQLKDYALPGAFNAWRPLLQCGRLNFDD